jgi:hypothetical protein
MDQLFVCVVSWDGIIVNCDAYGGILGLTIVVRLAEFAHFIPFPLLMQADQDSDGSAQSTADMTAFVSIKILL